MRYLRLLVVLVVAFTILGLTSSDAFSSESLDPEFFANATFQNQFPGAFALQKDSLEFVEHSLSKTFKDGDQLIASIESDPGLKYSILEFSSLKYPERVKILRSVFDHLVKVSGFLAPELVLDDSAKRSTFFEFDPSLPKAGKVILNPMKLFASTNPYDALLFLIHETRHSFQFQLAFLRNGEEELSTKKAFRLGFLAQKQIFNKGLKTSFCDFLTLNQEYEAFLFGNYVLEVLTKSSVDTSDMGTFASQYVPGEGLKINLYDLARNVGPDKLLDAFNELEKKQYQPK